jgi:hypothetical protein
MDFRAISVRRYIQICILPYLPPNYILGNDFVSNAVIWACKLEFTAAWFVHSLPL